MMSLFRYVVDRLKALVATAAAAELEAEFIARDAERKAELFRRAAQYEAEGLTLVAAGLRHQAENLSIERPCAVVLPALAHWSGEETPPPTTRIPPPSLPVNGSRKKLR
jgi:hypothetical protein